MNEETRKLFSELGSRNAKELAFRDSWVFVGAKGVQNKSPFEQVQQRTQYLCLLALEAWPLHLFTPQPTLHFFQPGTKQTDSSPVPHLSPGGPGLFALCTGRSSNFDLPYPMCIAP